MLGKRVVTAVVLLPLLVGVVLYGKGWPFLLLAGTATLLCAREYFRMFFPAARDRWSGVAITGLLYLSGALLPSRMAAAGMLCCVSLAAFPFLAGGEPHPEKARRASLSTLGAVYIGGFLSSYPRTIALPSGEHWILLGLAAVFSGDAFAYFVGKNFGKRLSRRAFPRTRRSKGPSGGWRGDRSGDRLRGPVPARRSPLVRLPRLRGRGGGGTGRGSLRIAPQACRGGQGQRELLPGHGGMFDRLDAVISAGPALYLLALLASLAGGPG